MIKMFVIVGAEYRKKIMIMKFWNNEFGWVDLHAASVYTEEEQDTLSLPVPSKGWLELPNILWETFQVLQYENDAKASATAEQLVPF